MTLCSCQVFEIVGSPAPLLLVATRYEQHHRLVVGPDQSCCGGVFERWVCWSMNCISRSPEAASPRRLNPTTFGQMASPQPEGDLDHNHVIHLTPSLTMAPKTSSAPPTYQSGPTLLPPTGLPLFLSSFTPRRRANCSSLWASSTSSAFLSGQGLSHTQALTISLWQYTGWVASLCMVCNQWCHHRYAGIHSSADYQRLASWSCLTCSTPVPPAAPTRESESSDMEHTHSTLSSGDSLSQRSRSIRPSSPAQTSTTAPGSSTCHWGRQVSAVQLKQHPTLTRLAAGLPSPLPGIGRLCARDQTQREYLPQGGVHLRVVDLSRPPLRPLHGAWWWDGGNVSSSCSLQGNHIDLCQCVYHPCVLLPQTVTPFWKTRWCLATLMPAIPPGFPEQGMTGQ